LVSLGIERPLDIVGWVPIGRLAEAIDPLLEGIEAEQERCREHGDARHPNRPSKATLVGMARVSVAPFLARDMGRRRTAFKADSSGLGLTSDGQQGGRGDPGLSSGTSDRSSGTRRPGPDL